MDDDHLLRELFHVEYQSPCEMVNIKTTGNHKPVTKFQAPWCYRWYKDVLIVIPQSVLPNTSTSPIHSISLTYITWFLHFSLFLPLFKWSFHQDWHDLLCQVPFKFPSLLPHPHYRIHQLAYFYPPRGRMPNSVTSLRTSLREGIGSMLAWRSVVPR